MSCLRIAVHRAARSFNGGIEALAAVLTPPQPGKRVDPQILRNQLGGNERHNLSLNRAEEIIDLCGSDELAHAAARQRGGVFLKLPEVGEHDRQDLLIKFNEVYAELGHMCADFNKFTEDGDLNEKEQAAIEDDAQRIHRRVEEVVALAISVFVRRGCASGQE